MKDDRLYLHHMLERCHRITRFIGSGREAFMASEELQDAVIRNVEVIPLGPTPGWSSPTAGRGCPYGLRTNSSGGGRFAHSNGSVRSAAHWRLSSDR